ncbi:unnamed protein product [Absidia cylindrospora]
MNFKSKIKNKLLRLDKDGSWGSGMVGWDGIRKFAMGLGWEKAKKIYPMGHGMIIFGMHTIISNTVRDSGMGWDWDGQWDGQNVILAVSIINNDDNPVVFLLPKCHLCIHTLSFLFYLPLNLPSILTLVISHSLKYPILLYIHSLKYLIISYYISFYLTTFLFHRTFQTQKSLGTAS